MWHHQALPLYWWWGGGGGSAENLADFPSNHYRKCCSDYYEDPWLVIQRLVHTKDGNCHFQIHSLLSLMEEIVHRIYQEQHSACTIHTYCTKRTHTHIALEHAFYDKYNTDSILFPSGACSSVLFISPAHTLKLKRLIPLLQMHSPGTNIVLISYKQSKNIWIIIWFIHFCAYSFARHVQWNLIYSTKSGCNNLMLKILESPKLFDVLVLYK